MTLNEFAYEIGVKHRREVAGNGRTLEGLARLAIFVSPPNIDVPNRPHIYSDSVGLPMSIQSSLPTKSPRNRAATPKHHHHPRSASKNAAAPPPVDISGPEWTNGSKKRGKNGGNSHRIHGNSMSWCCFASSYMVNCYFLVRYVDETISLDRAKFKNHAEQGIPFARTPPPSSVPSDHAGESSFQDTGDGMDMEDILFALQ